VVIERHGDNGSAIKSWPAVTHAAAHGRALNYVITIAMFAAA